MQTPYTWNTDEAHLPCSTLDNMDQNSSYQLCHPEVEARTGANMVSP